MLNRILYYVITLTLACFFVGISIAEEGENFIGVIDIKKDERVKRWSSYLLELPKPGITTNYSVSIIWTGKDYYFLIQRNISDDCKHPKWEVIDQMKAPLPPTGYYYEGHFCRKYKKQDFRIIALVHYDESKEFLNDVKAAWRVNADTVSFEQISTDGIDCVNTSYGL